VAGDQARRVQECPITPDGDDQVRARTELTLGDARDPGAGGPQGGILARQNADAAAREVRQERRDALRDARI
jgi:hypothetical protein